MFFSVIAQALFFALPLFFANMAPVVFDRMGWWKSLAVPVDRGVLFCGEDLFGTHKTWRGFLSGAFIGLCVGGLQLCLYNFLIQARWIFLFPYDSWSVVLLGFFLGFGALLGDLIKSFFKRRLHIADGASFFPFDQIDLVVGGLTIGALIYIPPWQHILVLLLLVPFLHVMVNVVAYLIGWKKVWW